jgi:hypothetical protein
MTVLSYVLRIEMAPEIAATTGEDQLRAGLVTQVTRAATRDGHVVPPAPPGAAYLYPDHPSGKLVAVVRVPIVGPPPSPTLAR